MWRHLIQETTNISLNVHKSYSLRLTSVSAVTWPRHATFDDLLWQLFAALHKRLDNASTLMLQRVLQPGQDEIYISWGSFRPETCLPSLCGGIAVTETDSEGRSHLLFAPKDQTLFRQTRFAGIQLAVQSSSNGPPRLWEHASCQLWPH